MGTLQKTGGAQSSVRFQDFGGGAHPNREALGVEVEARAVQKVDGLVGGGSHHFGGDRDTAEEGG